MDILKMGVNFFFYVQFVHEGQGQLSHKMIGILTKIFYTSYSNLVFLAWTDDELSHGQAHDWHIDTQTYTGHDNTHRSKLASGKSEIQKWKKLAQLERLCSEDTPAASYDPYYWVILDPKSKEGKVKVTNLKNLPKLQNGQDETHMLPPFQLRLMKGAIMAKISDVFQIKKYQIIYTRYTWTYCVKYNFKSVKASVKNNHTGYVFT